MGSPPVGAWCRSLHRKPGWAARHRLQLPADPRSMSLGTRAGNPWRPAASRSNVTTRMSCLPTVRARKAWVGQGAFFIRHGAIVRPVDQSVTGK